MSRDIIAAPGKVDLADLPRHSSAKAPSEVPLGTTWFSGRAPWVGDLVPDLSFGNSRLSLGLDIVVVGFLNIHRPNLRLDGAPQTTSTAPRESHQVECSTRASFLDFLPDFRALSAPGPSESTPFPGIRLLSRPQYIPGLRPDAA